MNQAPVRGCSLLIEALKEHKELQPLKSMINAWYTAWKGPREWTYCIRGSEDMELILRIVPKSRCAVCKHAAR